jgi:hypothetical protein
MNLDAFKTNGSSPPTPSYPPECRVIGCGPLTHNHNPRPDFLVADHGTIFLLQPITDRALAWVREHLSPDSPHFGLSLVVEHRFIADIVTGIRGDGLVVRS